MSNNVAKAPREKAAAPKSAKETNIQVVLRCRGRNDAEKKAGSAAVIECNGATREVIVKQPSPVNTDKVTTKTFTFDRVFGPDTAQQDLYADVVEPMLDEVIQGYNCTIFAYGQTGTGKTYTMEGRRNVEEPGTIAHDDPEAGIIPRTLHHLFDMLEKQSESEYAVKVSFVELYNEELRDLLGADEPNGANMGVNATVMSGNQSSVNARLRIFEDAARKGTVIIQGLEEVVVHNREEVYAIMARGSGKRATAATQMNQQSSRSHCVFTITVHLKETTVEGEELVKVGKFNLVDLAGSENVGRSGAINQRAREAGNINQSLLTLGRVITALVDHSPHVPYRESKLTRLLQDSLGGHTKTCIIATISPAAINLDETLSTLDYAHRAKSIKNRPEVNQRVSKRALIREYTEEIERLKRDLIAAREKSGIFVSGETFAEMERQIRAAAEGSIETAAKIDAYEQEITKLNGVFDTTKKELTQVVSELTTTKVALKGVEENLVHTKENLDRTEKQREERDIVAKVRKDNEDTLRETATSLLGTVQETIVDVDALHEKIHRKSSVESANALSASQLREDLCASATALGDMTCAFSSSHAAAVADITANFDALSANANSSGIAITAAAKALSVAVVDRLESLRAAMASRLDAANAQSLVEAEHMQAMKSSLFSALGSISADIASALVDGIASAAESYRNKSAEMAEASRRAIRAGEKLVAEHTIRQRAHVAGIVEKSSALVAATHVSVDARRDYFSSLIAGKQAEYAAATKAAVEQMQATLALLEKTHMEALGEAVSAMSASSAQTKEEFSAMHAVMTETTSTISTDLDCLDEKVAAVYSHMASCIDAHESAADGHVAATVAKTEETKTSCEHSLSAVETAFNAHFMHASELTSDAHKAWCEAVDANGTSIDVVSTAVLDGTNRIASDSADAAALLASGASKGVTAASEIQSMASAFKDDHTAAVAGVSARVEAYVLRELSADVPTGRTPKKRAYNYARHVPSPKIDEEILSNYRSGVRTMSLEGDCPSDAESGDCTASAVEHSAPASVAATVAVVADDKENEDAAVVCADDATTSLLNSSLSRLPVARRKPSVRGKSVKDADSQKPLETINNTITA